MAISGQRLEHCCSNICDLASHITWETTVSNALTETTPDSHEGGREKKGPGGVWGVPETAINSCNEQKWFFKFIILQI